VTQFFFGDITHRLHERELLCGPDGRCDWNGVSPVKDFGKSPARTKESPPENERRSLTA